MGSRFLSGCGCGEGCFRRAEVRHGGRLAAAAEFSTERCQTGTRRLDAREAPPGLPGAEEGSRGAPLGSLARTGTPEPIPSRSAGAPRSDPFPCSAKPGFHFPTLWLRCGSATIDRSKNQIYPSNPYPFANSIGAVPLVSSEPTSSRVPHRHGSFLPPSPFRSPAPRPPLFPTRPSCFSLLQTRRSVLAAELSLPPAPPPHRVNFKIRVVRFIKEP
ncbi:unnamed protein product [Rangifer tarandus platyrhynchus]|uniref:Uncharacterized protein n=1 Tax=Rangifer tarandus platyrhynchus TaxID=3082113 RepID=A0AC59Y2Q2_RANTA